MTSLRPLSLHFAACLLLVACSDKADDPANGGSAGAGSSGISGSSGNAGTTGSPAGGQAAAGGGAANAGAGAGAGGANGGSSTGTGGNSTPGVAGAGGTAGAAGGGVAGAAGANGSSCLATYQLCEDFEATATGATPTGWTAHGKAAVAEDQANAGKHALKIEPAVNGERRIYHPTTMLGAEHWGRVYYRVQLPIPEAFVHSTLVTFFGKGPTVGDAEFRVVDTVKDAKTGGFAGGRHQFLYNVQPKGAEFGEGSPYDYTFDDKWHCAEWHVNAADQSYQFFYDGKQVISFTRGAGKFDKSELPNGFAEVRLGWNNYQMSPPGFTAWLDDFAIDKSRIGCLPK